jgi:spore germination protein (amino acid permease)
MKKKTFFGKWEAVCVIVNLLCTKIFLNYPRLTVEVGANAGWIFTLYTALLASIGFLIIQKLYKPFEGKDLIDLGEHIAGGLGRIIIGMVIIFSLGYVTVVYLRTFSENMKLVAFNVTPLSFIEFFFLICMIAGAYFGIEAITRIHAIAIPFIVVGFVTLIIGVVNFIDLTNLTPIFGSGLDKIVIDGLPKVSVYSEILVLFLMTPFLKSHKTMKTTGFWSVGLASLFFLIISFTYSTVFSYPTTLEKAIPIFHIARLINLGRFFERVESIYMVIWAVASILFVVVNFYFILFTFQKIFNLKYYKPLIIPFAILIMNLSFFPPNLIKAVSLEVNQFRNWSWLIGFAMPVLLLILARLKKKKSA